jgi:hypothetical protein
MQFGELVAPSGDHDPEKCPFCPPEELKTYKTYAGEDNDSTVLRDIMLNPDSLTTKQQGARIKNGEGQNQDKSPPRLLPMDTDGAPCWLDIASEHKFGWFSSEAHHLISGKQALKGHAFEQWITEGTIKGPTGYSINNADNGVHAPSVPEKYKGTWGALHTDIKQKAAYWIMGKTGIQFHKGPHNIMDKTNDRDELYHMKYNIYIKEKLDNMNTCMELWQMTCPVCDDTEELPQPTARVNAALDHLSKFLEKKIRFPASEWDIFLSTLALLYHIDSGCTHRCCCKK